MTTYDDELAGLSVAYSAAASSPLVEELASAREVLRGRDAFAVASGGAFPAARLAAGLHAARTGGFGRALTPLAYAAESPVTRPACLILVSATCRHPDTARAAAAAVAKGHPVLLVTQRRPDELSGLMAHPSVAVLCVPQPGGRDGFLATQSLLISAAVLVRLYLGDSALPEMLPALKAHTFDLPPLRERVLVLHGPEERAAADDVEARLSESGLAAVQVADYRNLAHGRHYGLSRHLNRTTVVALAAPATAQLAERTLALLPPTTDRVWLSTGLAGAAGALDLLVQTMRLPVRAANDQRIALHRPGVPPFGRRLYHLAPRQPAGQATGAVARKMASAGLAPDHPSAAFYRDSFARWDDALRQQTIGALVLDYDGTLVTTAGRYDGPSVEVRQAVVGLLAANLPIAFASGRGDSLHAALRHWVPEEHWPLVELGLHNGAWRTGLTEAADERTAAADPLLAEAEQRLAAHPRDVLATRRTPTQLTVTSPDPLVGADSLRGLVEAVLRASPALPLNLASSGHSVDVTRPGLGKHSVVQDMQRRHGAVLAIGDRGDVGGNDFTMLAETQWSVSVDRCSADPGRCWAPADAGSTGPSALVEVLAALRLSRGGHRWRPGPGLRVDRGVSR